MLRSFLGLLHKGVKDQTPASFKSLSVSDMGHSGQDSKSLVQFSEKIHNRLKIFVEPCRIVPSFGDTSVFQGVRNESFHILVVTSLQHLWNFNFRQHPGLLTDNSMSLGRRRDGRLATSVSRLGSLAETSDG